MCSGSRDLFKFWITLTTLHNIPESLQFYGAKDIYEILMELPPTKARNAGKVSKNCVLYD